MCAVEQPWNFQVRSGEPDPLGADIVHVSEDGRDGASLAGWFGFPGGRVKMFDKKLVDAIIDRKYLACCGAEWSLRLECTRGHGGSLLRKIHGGVKVEPKSKSETKAKHPPFPKTGKNRAPRKHEVKTNLQAKHETKNYDTSTPPAMRKFSARHNLGSRSSGARLAGKHQPRGANLALGVAVGGSYHQRR
jgi:hypothetical protein